MKWKICDTDWNHWPEQWTDLDLWQYAKEIGLDGIELGVYSSQDELNDDRMEAIEKLTADSGIRVCGILLSLPQERWPNGALTGNLEGLLKEVDHIAATASEMKIPVIGIWPGADPEDSDPTALTLAIAAVAQAASNHGVQVAFEYKPDTALPDARRTLELLKGIENAGILIDTGHAFAIGEDPAEAIRETAKAGKLWHMHLGDAETGGADDDLPVGRVHDPAHYLRALNEVGYRGIASFDLYGAVAEGGMSSRSSVAESVRAVRAFNEGIEGIP